MGENNFWVSRVVARVGKAALFCFGLFAMLGLVVLAAVLAPVMLTATVTPPERRNRGEVRGTGGSAGTPRNVQRGVRLGYPEGGGYAGGEDSDGRSFG